MSNTILITAALPYANGSLHLGHIAGCYLNADIRNRFERMIGNKTLFISGSDSYGSAILMRAYKDGVSPRHIAEKYHEEHIKLFKKLDINFDLFGTTLSDLHEDTVKEMFLDLYENNAVFEREEEQLYDEDKGEFLADRFITGTCPKCNYLNARGDECEKCGESFDSVDLIDPISSISGKKLIVRTSKNFYLKMSDKNDLLENILKDKSWNKKVYKIAESYIGDLKDRCITRSIDWGVPVPEEKKSKDSSANVFYVWFDAPIGYISLTKQWFMNSEDPSGWKDIWLSNNSRIINYMGKDNVMFHSVMFPLMQSMSNRELHIADEIHANNFFLIDDIKFSKSSSGSIDINKLIDTIGADAVRFYVALNSPDNADVSCSLKGVVDDINTVLVGKIGNLVNRVMVFAKKSIGDEIPYCIPVKNLEVFEIINKYNKEIKECYSSSQVRRCAHGIQSFAEEMNRFFDKKKPWTLTKSEERKDELELIVINCIYAIKSLAVFMKPITPLYSSMIMSMINKDASSNNIEKWDDVWDDVMYSDIDKGTVFGDSKVIISRDVLSDIM